MNDYIITSMEIYAKDGRQGIGFRVIVKPESKEDELKLITMNIIELFKPQAAHITVWFWGSIDNVLIEVRNGKIKSSIQPYDLAMVETALGEGMKITWRKEQNHDEKATHKTDNGKRNPKK